MSVVSIVGQVVETFISICTGQEIGKLILDFGLKAMGSFIGSLLTTAINGLRDLMNNMTNACFSLIAIDIGNGGSLFEEVFGNLDNLVRIFQILGFSFLAVFFILNIVKTMVSPSENSETPFRLSCSFILTGSIIFFSKPLVLIAEQIFNPFYMAFKHTFLKDQVDFIKFSDIIRDSVKEKAGFIIPGTAASAAVQITSILNSILLLIILLLAVVIFIKYLIEIIQHYLMMGIMIISSPVAMSLAFSKSTRISFVKWMRMLICQFLTLTVDIMFTGVFLYGVAHVEAALSIYNGNSTAAGLLLWGISIYAMLNVGRSFSSYLKSVGLSVSEAGSGLGTSFFAEMASLFGIIKLASGSRRKDAKVRNTDPTEKNQSFSQKTKAEKGDEGSHNKTASQNTTERNTKTAKDTTTSSTPFGMDMNGAKSEQTTATPHEVRKSCNSISDLMEAVYCNSNMEAGPDIGNVVIGNMKGLPNRLTSKMDVNSFYIKDGIIYGCTIPSASGSVSKISFTPIDKTNDHSGPGEMQRNVTIGNIPYVAKIESGPFGFASYFMSYDSHMRHTMDKKYGESVEPVQGTGHKWAGTYRLVKQTNTSANEPSRPPSNQDTTASTVLHDGTTKNISDDEKIKLNDLSTSPTGSKEQQSSSSNAQPDKTSNGRVSGSYIEHAQSLNVSNKAKKESEKTNVQHTTKGSIHDQKSTLFEVQEWASANCYTVNPILQDNCHVVDFDDNPIGMAAAAFASNNTVPSSVQNTDTSTQKAKCEGSQTRVDCAHEYFKYSIPMVLSENGKLSGLCDHPEMPTAQEERPRWLQTEFPDLKDKISSIENRTSQDVKNDKDITISADIQQDGITYLHVNESYYQLGAITECRIDTPNNDPTEKGTTYPSAPFMPVNNTYSNFDKNYYETIKASNGVKYALLKVKSQNNSSKIEAHLIPHHWDVENEPFADHSTYKKDRNKREMKKDKVVNEKHSKMKERGD